MYGLILENLSQYTCRTYGDDKWQEIRKLAKIEQPTFSIHKIYPDNYVSRITSKACEVLGVTEKEFLYNVGVSFVSFVGVYGYDKVLSVLGRQFRDFLNGLDNLHEYLRFSYPKIKPPSFFCNDENENGMTLQYRSKRAYFLWYAIGQIKEIGRHYYKTDVTIKVISEKYEDDEYCSVLRLLFDNRAFVTASQPPITKQLSKLSNESTANTDQISLSLMPLKANSLFQIFPFCLVFDSELIIKAVGGCLQVVLPDIAGNALPNVFILMKPKVGYNWLSISGHINTTFELASIKPLKRDNTKRDIDLKTDRRLSVDNLSDDLNDSSVNDSNDNEINSCHEYLLRLKGQMLYMEEWKCMVFLAAPNIENVEAMTRTGLYLNDLSLHDFSRDMVLAGQQQTAELKLALDQELHKSKQLEESMFKLDIEMKRTDELLYQMIKNSRPSETRRKSSEYMSNIVNFTVICSRITPMQVVNMLNSMYSLFDELTERHCVYKVETIGDAYMICSGGGILDGQDNINHAQKVCEIALDMIHVVFNLKDPSSGNNLNIRIGAVVGGIVGLKMPRYCFFGDTVNTASRIESSSEAQMVQISEMTKAMLDLNEWNVYERGTIQLKGKGFMKTYWLYGRRTNDLSSDSSTTVTLPLKRANRNNSPKDIMSGELESALLITNRNEKLTTKSRPLVSIDGTYETRLDQLVQIRLTKEVLSDEPDTDNTDTADQSVKTAISSSLIDIEGQQRHRQRQNTVIDKSGTNKIIINNSFLGSDKTTEQAINASDHVLENNDRDQGCFSCNQKLKTTGGRRSDMSCVIL